MTIDRSYFWVQISHKNLLLFGYTEYSADAVSSMRSLFWKRWAVTDILFEKFEMCKLNLMWSFIQFTAIRCVTYNTFNSSV